MVTGMPGKTREMQAIPGYTWVDLGDAVHMQVYLGRSGYLIGFGAMALTKPYKFMGFGAIAITKP